MNCLLFIHFFNSEYLGSLPKFKGIFVRRLRRLHTLTWPRWESSQPGQEVPLWWTQRRENIKWSLVQAVPPTMSLSPKANPESLTPSTPHSPTAFLFSQVSRDVNSLGTELMKFVGLDSHQMVNQVMQWENSEVVPGLAISSLWDQPSDQGKGTFCAISLYSCGRSWLVQ